MMKFLYKILTVSCLILFTVQCEVIDTDLLDSPNAVAPENVDPDFLLNNIQKTTQDIYTQASEFGAILTRMRYLFGSTYGNAGTVDEFKFDLNNLYEDAYAELLIDVKNLIPIAEEQSLHFHAGMAKILQAYVMIVMVDIFGDIPYSEALQGSANFNPGLDEGSTVYAAALSLIDEGIADLQNPDRLAFPDNDLFYGVLDDEDDQEAAWIKAANTIKLKAYLNTGDATAINALNIDDLISDPADDFRFDFSTNISNPDARHPLFSETYVNLPGDDNYLAVNYLNIMLNDKADEDPRMRYYFYRQTTTDPTDVNLNTCINAFPPAHFQPGDPFCLLGDGWWGRDHLIDDGIPPDNGLRTTYGVYPVGGEFDENQGESVEQTMGLQGAGFEPLLISSYTWFMLAEAELTLNNNPGAARTALNEALEHSFETVAAVGLPLAAGSPFEMDPDSAGGPVENYIDEVMDRWDNFTGRPAGDSDAEYRLRTIAKEYYLALWPNGVEAYNAMRRTGYPNRADNLQPARAPSPGNWFRTIFYPENMVERNSSIEPKQNTLVRTFWDTRGQDDEFNF